MDCGTFFKGITTAFNLYVKPSKDNPTVMEIETMDEFYNDSNAALNWTNLVDYSKDYKVTPTVNFASSKYNFLFDADDDYYNAQYQQDVRKQYGSFVVDSQSQFARDKTDLSCHSHRSC
jgi:hypothetical protein